MTTFRFIPIALAAMATLAGNNLVAQTNYTDYEQPANPPEWSILKWRWSMTEDGGYDHHPQDDKGIPLPWQNVRESDMLWKKRVWREIDAREKQNVAFMYAGDEHTGGGMFIEILIDAVSTGKVAAYSTIDDRFTTPYTRADLYEQLRGKPDTNYVINPVDESETMVVTYKEFDPATVTKYRLIEDWIFDRGTGKMVVRIVGIAPIKDIYGPDGSFRGSQPMFWLYYPDLRETLARYETVNPANDMHRATWDEFFEDRKFASRITKVSNATGGIAGGRGQGFKESGMSDMEALYQDKAAANATFNKEHDMWEY